VQLIDYLGDIFPPRIAKIDESYAQVITGPAVFWGDQNRQVHRLRTNRPGNVALANTQRSGSMDGRAAFGSLGAVANKDRAAARYKAQD
jgi:hypothetical protein